MNKKPKNKLEKETNTLDVSKYPMNYRTREEAKALLGSVTSMRVNGLIEATEEMKAAKEANEENEK